MINFKRANLCEGSSYPLYVYEAVDVTKSDDVIEALKAKGFTDKRSGVNHRAIRIHRKYDSACWVIRISDVTNSCYMNLMEGEFETKKDAIQFVNERFVNN